MIMQLMTLLMALGVATQFVHSLELESDHGPVLGKSTHMVQSVSNSRRSLLQSVPDGCLSWDNRARRCSQCRMPYVPSVDSKACVCPAGTSLQRGKCDSCPVGYFCDQSSRHGRLGRKCPNNLVTKQTGAKKLSDCVNDKGFFYVRPTSRSNPNSRQGMNLATRLYTTAAATSTTGPAALPCPTDSYSAGLNYEEACTPCPDGFHTDPSTTAGDSDSVAACLAPPGSYVDPELHIVVPCEPGTYSDTYSNDSYCMSCYDVTGPTGLPLGAGITTAGPGATSAADCRFLGAGFALADAKGAAILTPLQQGQVYTGAKPCPQRYYCPGGDPAAEGVPQLCPRGMWTAVEATQPDGSNSQDVTVLEFGDSYEDYEDSLPGGGAEDVVPGAASIEACVAPPGWVLPVGDGDIQECPTGSFKEGWNKDTACTSCGEGLWLSDPVDSIVAVDPLTGATSTLDVRGSALSCYIQQGMGIVHGAAVICPANTYGTAVEKRYGNDPGELQPCTPCLGSMVTIGNSYKATSFTDATGTSVAITEVQGGYFSNMACVTRPGWGYNPYATGGSEECEAGTWNEGGNLSPCKSCPSGTTTPTVGSTSAADCSRHAPGWGTGPAGNKERCQVGFYSDGTLSLGAPCARCPAGTTTYEKATTSVEDCITE